MMFLSSQGNSIVNSKNKSILLRGVNLGGWLMMEGYILHGRNIPEKAFKQRLIKSYGKKETESFMDEFRSSFIQEDDFRNISDLKLNCIRLPFNFRLIENEKRPFEYNEKGIDYLEKALGWCEENNIYCILDMHAAPGSQNHDWHSDSNGEADLWSNKAYQERFFRLWEFIADRFKDRSIVAGYNVLNEPVIKKAPKGTLRNFYKETVKFIRKVDKKHIIFLEGNLWSRVLEDIGEPFDSGLSYSIHYYDPVDFTHNTRRGLKYPGTMNGEYWDRGRIQRDLERYYKLGRKWSVPIFLGEFGINHKYTAGNGKLEWLKDVLFLCNEYDFHWTFWTYKTIANSLFPSGLYQCMSNPTWINRMGPVCGWETYYTLWKRHKNEIIESWKTEYFRKNPKLINLISQYSYC